MDQNASLLLLSSMCT